MAFPSQGFLLAIPLLRDINFYDYRAAAQSKRSMNIPLLAKDKQNDSPLCLWINTGPFDKGWAYAGSPQEPCLIGASFEEGWASAVPVVRTVAGDRMYFLAHCTPFYNIFSLSFESV